MTANTGLNISKFPKKINCFVNLPEIIQKDYEWDDYIYKDTIEN